jgi:hypothetical protein
VVDKIRMHIDPNTDTAALAGTYASGISGSTSLTSFSKLSCHPR